MSNNIGYKFEDGKFKPIDGKYDIKEHLFYGTADGDTVNINPSKLNLTTEDNLVGIYNGVKSFYILIFLSSLSFIIFASYKLISGEVTDDVGFFYTLLIMFVIVFIITCYVFLTFKTRVFRNFFSMVGNMSSIYGANVASGDLTNAVSHLLSNNSTEQPKLEEILNNGKFPTGEKILQGLRSKGTDKDFKFTASSSSISRYGNKYVKCKKSKEDILNGVKSVKNNFLKPENNAKLSADFEEVFRKMMDDKVGPSKDEVKSIYKKTKNDSTRAEGYKELLKYIETKYDDKLEEFK